jgi:hypothetical protein
MRSVEVYYPLRRRLGHRIAWWAERFLARIQGRHLCCECGDTARFQLTDDEALSPGHVRLLHVIPGYYCRKCAWLAYGGQKPPCDDDEEPPWHP